MQLTMDGIALRSNSMMSIPRGRGKRSSQMEKTDEYSKSVQCQSQNNQRWSLRGLRRLAHEQANHRHEFSGRVSQMDCGADICRTTDVPAVPLWTQREEAVLR